MPWCISSCWINCGIKFTASLHQKGKMIWPSHSLELNSNFGGSLQSSVNKMSNTLDPCEAGGKFSFWRTPKSLKEKWRGLNSSLFFLLRAPCWGYYFLYRACAALAPFSEAGWRWGTGAQGGLWVCWSKFICSVAGGGWKIPLWYGRLPSLEYQWDFKVPELRISSQASSQAPE